MVCVCVFLVSQWEVPKDFQRLAEQTKSEATADSSSSSPTSCAASSTTDSQLDGLKRSAQQAGVEEPQVCPKRRGGAYGSAWTTVAEYDRHEPEPEESETHKESEDLPTKKQEIHFEEKTLTGSLEPEEDESVGESFKAFSFKKRNNKGVNKMRERTSHF